MSNRSKGAAVEKEAEALLVADGYLAHRAIAATMRRGPIFVTHSNDILGMFDILAIKAGLRPLLVQVTHPSGVSARKRKIVEHIANFPFEHVDVCIWEKRGRRHDVHRNRVVKFFRVITLQPDGTWKATGTREVRGT